MSTRNDMTKREDKRTERVEQRRLVSPPVDIFENANELLLVADMPGVPEDRIRIRVEKNQLTLEGAFETDENAPKELGLNAFSYLRNFLLPGGIDTEKISAELRNGILQVHLPKEERLKPRQITVQAG